MKFSDGTLAPIPVLYGDPERQVASIIRQNTENAVNYCPRIAIYLTGLELDSERRTDPTYVGKIHVRERDIENGAYNLAQGRNYTIERHMPTPYKLTMKADIWSANTDQKLQILEQILVLFNPSVELQTNDNYLDWTSLSVLTLESVSWSSRSIPVGTDTPIDIASLTISAPAYISPPAKVKNLGVITRIITSLYNSGDTDNNQYIDGLGQPVVGPDTGVTDQLSKAIITSIAGYNILVYGSTAQLLKSSENALPYEPSFEIPIRQGPPLNWTELFAQYPGKYVAGSSRIFLIQSSHFEIVGTIAVNPMDPTLLNIVWDEDTLPTNTGIDSHGRFDTDANYNTGINYRSQSPGTFDAIIDPLKVGPNNGISSINSGDRFLLVEDIGANINTDGADAWKNNDGSDLVAHGNDIIEWTGTAWNVIFDSVNESDTLIYQTNIFTGIQFMWNGVSWVKSYDGEYRRGSWRIEL